MSSRSVVFASAIAWATSASAASVGPGAVAPDATATAADDPARDANDAAITIEVGRQLASAAPAARHVEILPRNGIVTLAGRVQSQTMRQRVVSLAIATEGVVGVNDQLVVVPKPSPSAGH